MKRNFIFASIAFVVASVFTSCSVSDNSIEYVPEPPVPQKETVWENDGSLGEISWNGNYRFSSPAYSTGEECYIVPQDIWEKLKTQPFYVTIKGESPQIRVTSGWWSVYWTENDIFPGNQLLTVNGDGTYTLAVNLVGSPLLDVIDAQHLLFTGSGYVVEEIYFSDAVPGTSDQDDVDNTVIWENDGTLGATSWNGIYRFGLVGNDGNNECLATFQPDVWNKIKTGPFYLQAAIVEDWYNLRITTGWWDVTWADVLLGDQRLVLNGDGTFTIKIDFTGDPILDVLDAHHLLFTGQGFTPLKIYTQE